MTNKKSKDKKLLDLAKKTKYPKSMVDDPKWIKIREKFVSLKDGKYSWNLNNPKVMKHLSLYSKKGSNPFSTNEFFKIILELTFGLNDLNGEKIKYVRNPFINIFKIGDSVLKMGNVWKIQRNDGLVLMVEDMREIFDCLNFVERFKIEDNGDVFFRVKE